MIAGVAGGLADYFEIDVVLLRIMFLLLLLFGGGGILAYVILWIVAPKEPWGSSYASTENPNSQQKAEFGEELRPEEEKPKTRSQVSNTSLFTGIALIVIGLFFLVNRMFPWFRLEEFWPLLLIIGGAFIIDPNLLKSKTTKDEI